MAELKRDPAQVFVGGPGAPDRALRDLLERRIAATPAGGEIVWATYYFRDRALADALIAASDRGVRVTLHVEGQPRRADANAAVLARLGAHGLGGGLHIHRPPRTWPSRWRGHLHLKLYGFSHPVPTMLAGSFNPSGDTQDDPDVIAEIGDQDRGYNVLVELTEPGLVSGLFAHVRRLDSHRSRFGPAQNAVLEGAQATAWFWPRLGGPPIYRAIRAAGAGDRLRGAISHLKPGVFASTLVAAARRGADVALVVHDTQRRVPDAVLNSLTDGGVRVAPYRHPRVYPLHAKLMLIERGDDRSVWFGSFNHNARSRWLNEEVLLMSRDPTIVGRLAKQLDAIFAEAGGGMRHYFATTKDQWRSL